MLIDGQFKNTSVIKMKIPAPKCPACHGWMYISSSEKQEYVDVAPEVFIYWTCGCSKADAYPLDVITVVTGGKTEFRHRNKHIGFSE